MESTGKWAAELDCARELARAAGEATLSHFGNTLATVKAGGSPVTEADLLANRIIVDGLRRRFPAYGLLSEESRDSAGRLSHDRVWVVDPLDGTREFMAGIAEYSVMIGLAVEGAAVLGVVYCPADGVLYSGVVGEGAWEQRGGSQHALVMPDGSAARLRLVGSRSHPDERLVRIQAALGITDVRPSGSVGVKCALVARGECDVYVHPVPYLKEWDTCAPEAVLRGAGGVVTDCTGGGLRYNKPDPVQPAGIVATSYALLPSVLDAVRSAWVPDVTGAAAATVVTTQS
jgi:3'(2'), 5'-bisphosphate nucleotidase